MSDRLTRQGVRDLDALGPRRQPGVRRVEPINCVERGELHRWRPTGETRYDGDGISDYGAPEVLYKYACPCGATEWRTR